MKYHKLMLYYFLTTLGMNVEPRPYRSFNNDISLCTSKCLLFSIYILYYESSIFIRGSQPTAKSGKKILLFLGFLAEFFLLEAFCNRLYFN